MGSPKTEAERYKDELEHSVTLTQGFWLADTTVTQALWQAVMGNNPSSFQEDQNNPVENVSWDDAQDFIAEFNKLIPGLQAKLPSEAQWEYE
jgi:formylglycine-generating enzyme required for sulfatase activity